LFFPRSINENWDIEVLLKDELFKLRQCSLDGILYLNASPEVLQGRKEKDKNRSRGFFEHYINGLHIYKKQWFARYDYTTFLNVDNMPIDEVEAFAVEWLEKL
jgi:deoxyadenosine/deoxycytidine kinase